MRHLLAVLLMCSAAFPQLNANHQNDPIFRSTTRLVQLNIVVLDRQQHPVSCLSKNDFHVFDNGTEEKIVHFWESLSISASPSKISPLVLTNRPQAENASAGITIVLVDELVLQDIYAAEAAKLPIKSARLAVLRFLASLPPYHQVGLYALRQEGVVVIHDVTDDGAALLAAAKSLGQGLRSGTTRIRKSDESTAALRLRDWFDMASLGQHMGIDQHQKDADTAPVIGGLLGLAQRLREVPGRKNLVWISSTFPQNVSDFNMALMLNEVNANVPSPTSGPQYSEPKNHYDELRRFARLLSDANISVYAIDAHGLMSNAPDEGQRATAKLIASETGGRSIFDSNGLDQQMREIVEESNQAYQLDYSPGGRWDGKYHRIELKLNRNGLTTLCRKGYFAVDQPISQNSDASLRLAAKSVGENLGIGVSLNVSSNPLERGPEDVVLKLNAHDIHFAEVDGRWRANLDVLFAGLGKDGRVLQGIKDHIELALFPDNYAEVAAEGWFYPKHVFVSPKAEKLRVVVRDLATGAIGSVSVPVRHNKGV